MKEKDLIRKIAKLESINDQLVAELRYLEELTKALGFAQGLKTLKEAALEMLDTQDVNGDSWEDETNPPKSST
jgi:hypothetical protein